MNDVKAVAVASGSFHECRKDVARGKEGVILLASAPFNRPVVKRG